MSVNSNSKRSDLIRRCEAALSIGLALGGTMLSEQVVAHGFVLDPPSRAYFCKQGENSECGAIRYEPQSVEGPDGYPEAGPSDGVIASAGSSTWAPLNEQSDSRWKKTRVTSGLQHFTWTLTAPHVARSFSYYITTADWNRGAALTRESFSKEPFCVYDGNMRRPPFTVVHECTLPARSGYHVVLAVWDVGDTSAAFYNVIDVVFDGSGTAQATALSDSVEIGHIYPSMDLVAGDLVSLRLFTAEQEVPGDHGSVMITDEVSGVAQTWPRLLAGKINGIDDGVFAGAVQGDQRFVARDGQNTIWAQPGSRFRRAEVQIVKGPNAIGEKGAEDESVLPSFQVSAVNTADSQTTIQLEGLIGSPFTLTASLIPLGSREPVTSSQQLVRSGQDRIDLEFVSMERGEYTLLLHTGDGSAAGADNQQIPVYIDGRQQGPAEECGLSTSLFPVPAAWEANVAYHGGSEVWFANERFVSKWWTQNETPGSSDVWERRDLNAVIPEWDPVQAYSGGQTVRFMDRQYTAKWWSRGEEPSLATGWIELGAIRCD